MYFNTITQYCNLKMISEANITMYVNIVILSSSSNDRTKLMVIFKQLNGIILQTRSHNYNIHIHVLKLLTNIHILFWLMCCKKRIHGTMLLMMNGYHHLVATLCHCKSIQMDKATKRK